MKDAVPPCYKAARVAKLNCLATDPSQNEPVPASGRVWLLEDNPRESEIVFDFAFHEELNEAVKELPRRWFDWRRKHWRVPAHPRVAKEIEALLGRFPDLVPSPEVLAWLSDSDRWRAICTVVAREGRGHFLVRTLQGDSPRGARGRARGGGGPRAASVRRGERGARAAARRTASRRPGAPVRARAARRPAAASRGALGPDGRGRRATPHALPRLGPRPRQRLQGAVRGAAGAPARTLLPARRSLGSVRSGRPGTGAAAVRVRRGPSARARGGAGAGADRGAGGGARARFGDRCALVRR